MSLVAFAIRIAAIKMLRGATLAGPAVYDSPLDPVPQALSAKTPLIHVYTESETLKTDGMRDLLQGQRTVNLTLQLFLPVNEKVEVAGKALGIATRKGGGQAILDVMYRQVEAALVGNDGVWHGLFRDLVDGYRDVMVRPYVIQTDKGVRLAAREIELVCFTQSSPAFGPPSDLWQRLVDAMKADADLQELAPFVETQITGNLALTPDDIARVLLGYSVYEASAVGLTSSGASVNDDPAAAADIEISTDPDAPAPDGYVVAP